MLSESTILEYTREVLRKNSFKNPDVVLIDNLKVGENHRLYKVSCRWNQPGNSLELVIRTNIIKSDYERAKFEREARVLSFLEGYFAPRLFDYDSSGRWFPEPVMCMAFIPGTSTALNNLPPERLEVLGDAFRRIHTLDIRRLRLDQDADRRLSMGFKYPIDYLISRWSVDLSLKVPADDLGLPPASVLRRFWLAHDRLVLYLLRNLNGRWFEEELKLCLTHADAGSDNIIWDRDNQPYLIDWEYTRLGDPAEEIAYIITENCLDEAHTGAFWRGYARDAIPEFLSLKERVAVWRPITASGSGLWWLDRYVRALKITRGILRDDLIDKPPEFYLAKALEKLVFTERFSGI